MNYIYFISKVEEFFVFEVFFANTVLVLFFINACIFTQRFSLFFIVVTLSLSATEFITIQMNKMTLKNYSDLIYLYSLYTLSEK